MFIHATKECCCGILAYHFGYELLAARMFFCETSYIVDEARNYEEWA
jgi:hypothetical protein